MIAAALRLEEAGADLLVICTNTMHKVADEVQKDIRVPLLHIADATAGEIKARGLKKVGLLGTRATMEEDFYTGRLFDKHGLDVITPNERRRELIEKVIYGELCRGQINATQPCGRRRRRNNPRLHRDSYACRPTGCADPRVRYYGTSCEVCSAVCIGAIALIRK